MPSPNFLELQQSTRVAGLSGHWALASGQAISLRSRAPGVLRVAQGRVWITLSGPHPALGRELGDHFLRQGESLPLRAGSCVVMESWCEAADTQACFEWVPDARRGAFSVRRVWCAVRLAASLAAQQVFTGVGRLVPR